jgi:hypothetical protein
VPGKVGQGSGIVVAKDLHLHLHGGEIELLFQLGAEHAVIRGK